MLRACVLNVIPDDFLFFRRQFEVKNIMANIYVTKDDSSLYLTNFLEAGEQIQYDWSLSKSYTVVTGKGVSELSLGSSNETFSCQAVGLHRIPPGEEITASATGKTIFIVPFLCRYTEECSQHGFLTPHCVSVLAELGE